ncbi:MAG: trimethylamine methyltransferase family protein, partial [Actinomycetota bacterium]|nr:trimethylamine methyltransferase family protein [Actinomycetota bacterium]
MDGNDSDASSHRSRLFALKVLPTLCFFSRCPVTDSLTPQEGIPLLKSENRSDKRALGRRGGRTSRTASRRLPSFIGSAEPLRRSIPTYELLDEDDLVRLEEHSDWILDEIGVEIHDGEALDLFRQAGARVDGRQARFEPGFVRAL